MKCSWELERKRERQSGLNSRESEEREKQHKVKSRYDLFSEQCFCSISEQLSQIMQNKLMNITEAGITGGTSAYTVGNNYVTFILP